MFFFLEEMQKYTNKEIKGSDADWVDKRKMATEYYRKDTSELKSIFGSVL